jgi:hypothetical protein
MRVVACVITASLLAPLGAAETSASLIDLRLSDGTRVMGPLLQETPDAFTVHQVVLTRHGSISADRTFAKSDVVDCVRVQAEYERRNAVVADDATSQAGLARWCLDEQLGDEADLHAHRALALDPAEATAAAVLAALGYVDDHGRWVKADAYLAARGLVCYQGKVMDLAQRDGLVKLAAQRTVDRNQAQTAQDQQDAITHASALDQERIDRIAKENADIDQHLASDQQAADSLTSSKKALDAADARVRKEEAKHRTGAKGGGSPSEASLEAQRKAKEDYDSAAVVAGQAQTDASEQTAQKKALTADAARARTDRDAQQAKLPLATLTAASAAATASASEQRYAQAFAEISSPDDLPPQFASGIRPAAAPGPATP